MIRHLLIGATVLGALLMTGCASVVNGHNQSVSVTTKSQGTELAGAKCSLSNDKGIWYVTTPGSVAVHRSYGELSVNCASAGLPDGVAAVKSSTTAAVFGNILVGGVIGAGIDVATGAAYNYPNLIPVDMGRTTRIEIPPTPAATARAPTPPTPSDPALAEARVPYLNEARQAQYQLFLTKPMPRAFAVSDTGHYAMTWGTKPRDPNHPADPSARALLRCKETAGKDCELFVVDNQIVYKARQPTPSAAPPDAAIATAPLK